MQTVGAGHFMTMLARSSMQAGVLVLVVVLAQWLFRKHLTPRWRCALWLLVVLRLVLPGSPGSSLSIFNWMPRWQAEATSSTEAVATTAPQLALSVAHPPATGPELEKLALELEQNRSSALEENRTAGTREMLPSPPETRTRMPAMSGWDWPLILLGAWLAVALALAVHTIVLSVRLARKFSRFRPVNDPLVLEVLRQCHEQLHMRSKFRVREGREIASPALYGLFRPCLLLPKGFTSDFSPRELRFVFLHELAHLKRRDLWLNWLFTVLQVIHWFNPLVWLAFSRWRADRELACDAMALEAVGAEQSRDYGRTILRLLEHFTHPTAAPGMVGILEDKRQLKHRIEMIARFKPSSRWSLLALILMSLIAAGCLTDAKKNGQSAKSNASPSTASATNIPPLVIDLKPFYTFNGDDGYGGFTGSQTVDGLPFDIAGQIMIYGKTSAERGSHDPREVEGIKIGRKFDELHLIHDVVWEDAVGRPVVTVRLHYADGSSHDFVLRYGVQVADWNRLLSEETEFLTDTNSKIIRHYEGVNKGTGRLFETMLENPHPEKPVETMDLISANGWATYRLAAATVANKNPLRAVTPGLPLNEPARHFDGALTVKVVDRETGAPIAHADVLGYTEVNNEGIVIPPLQTATNGETVIKYPVSETASIGFTVSKSGYLGQRGSWQLGGIPDHVTYRLTRSRATIQGTVTDDAGKPVAKAQVRLNNYNSNPDSSGNQAYLPSTSAQTDAAGHWSIEGLPANYQDFGVTVTHPDFPQAQFFADGPSQRGYQGNHVSTADFFSGTAVLKLSRGQIISGTVRDPAGNPVPHAALFVGFDRYMSGAIKAQTDAGGNFVLKNIGLGENYLTISADGFAPDFLTVFVAASNAPQNVVLKPGKVIHGRVLDTAGQPVEGAEISYDGLADRHGIFSGRTMEWKTRTDAGGNFSWDAAPIQPILLTIMKGGYMTLEWTPVQTDTTNATIFTLNSPLTVKGSVTDADSGEPVAKFQITPGWPENGGARLEKRRATSESNGHYEVHFDSPIIISSTPYDFVFQISAPGYAPVQSRAIKPAEGVVVWDVKLKKTPVVIAQVRTAAGRPAADVKIFLARARSYLQLNDAELSSQSQDDESFQTDADGHFELPPQTGDYTLVAASPAGFAQISRTDFTNSLALTLQPWARIEGTLLNHGRPLAGRQLYFFAGDDSAQRNLWMKTPVTVDAQGHFAFPYVPPGTVRIELKQPMTDRSWSYKELQTIEVKPGETNSVPVVLDGRDVTGHWKRGADLPADANLEQGNFSLRPDVEPPPVPKDMDSPEKIQKWYQDWMKTDDGKKFVAAERKGSQLQMKSDGTLYGEFITPGKYTLSGNFWGNAGTVAEVESREVVIPESSATDPDAPFDLGEFIVKAVKHLNIGEAAPDFSVKTLEDQPLKLSDFRGKYVLVDFWATWCGPCVAETPHLKAAFDAYGNDSRFVMISLSLDQKADLPKKFAQEHDIKWTQGFLGDWSKDTVTKDYCVRGIPSIFLVGPDGKIIAQNLRGEAIKSAVGSALRAQ